MKTKNKNASKHNMHTHAPTFGLSNQFVLKFYETYSQRELKSNVYNIFIVFVCNRNSLK